MGRQSFTALAVLAGAKLPSEIIYAALTNSPANTVFTVVPFLGSLMLVGALAKGHQFLCSSSLLVSLGFGVNEKSKNLLFPDQNRFS